jgi:hypothetical protein
MKVRLTPLNSKDESFGPFKKIKQINYVPGELKMWDKNENIIWIPLENKYYCLLVEE